MVVVHGGGRQMTRYLAERGVESQFVNGLRVTTPEVLDAVIKVVAGSVNRAIGGGAEPRGCARGGDLRDRRRAGGGRADGSGAWAAWGA